jgi:uncharacterized protein (DUF427 family)
MLATVSIYAKRPKPVPVGSGEESVWDYPRPPRLEAEPRRIVVVYNGITVIDTTRALRVLETSHPPTYYLPPEDFTPDTLIPAGGTSYCEWKGVARSWSVRAGGREADRAGWSYAHPSAPYAALTDYIALYCSAMDRCEVDGDRAWPQPGGFYGGWVNSWIKGPFKGDPETLGW